MVAMNISCKIFEPFYFRIQQLGSTQFKGRCFGAKTSWSTLDGSTPLISGSGILDPDRLSSCTIYTCLLYEIYYLETRSRCVNTSFIINSTVHISHWYHNYWHLLNIVSLLDLIFSKHSLLKPAYLAQKLMLTLLKFEESI
jgi:hypothetical protein